MKYFNETFIRQCHSDRKAQKELFEQLYAPMYRVCFRYLNHEADAEDCTMRGFLKAFQKIEQFHYEGEHAFFAWVRKIMVNEALMFIRQKHNFLLSLEEKHHDSLNYSTDIGHQLNAEDLYNLITLLPTGYRTVFNLNVVEGYNHAEIAAMLGISENTSRTQLAKARNKLKLMLEQTNIGYGKAGR